MNCDTFQQRLHYLLDRRVSPRQDPELHSHALICGECQAHLEMQERLLEALGSFEPPPHRDDFADRIVAAVCHRDSMSYPVASISRRTENRRWIGIATCLGLLILAGAWHLSRQGEPPADMAPWAQVTTLPPMEREYPERDHAEREHVAREHGDRAEGLFATQFPPDNSRHLQPPLMMEQVSEETRPFVAWGSQAFRAGPHGLPMTAPGGLEVTTGSGYPHWLTALTSQLPEVPPESLQSVDQIAGGLRPIAETLGAAFDTIRRSLPIVDREDRPAGKPQAGLSSRVLIG